MPKCSCAGNSCNCTFEVGDGLSISGTGNSGSPYVVSISAPTVQITHAAAGDLDLSGVSSGSVVSVTLQAGATSITLPPNAGAAIDLVLWQGTAGRTVVWPDTIKWPGGVAPVLSTTLDYGDWIRLRSISTDLWVGAVEAAAIR